MMMTNDFSGRWLSEDTKDLDARITEQMTFIDFDYAADRGFVPTSKTMPPSHNWGGKYRCVNCTVTGYFWKDPNPYWWGNYHGDQCRKRP